MLGKGRSLIIYDSFLSIIKKIGLKNNVILQNYALDPDSMIVYAVVKKGKNMQKIISINLKTKEQKEITKDFDENFLVKDQQIVYHHQ